MPGHGSSFVPFAGPDFNCKYKEYKKKRPKSPRTLCCLSGLSIITSSGLDPEEDPALDLDPIDSETRVLITVNQPKIYLLWFFVFL